MFDTTDNDDKIVALLAEIAQLQGGTGAAAGNTVEEVNETINRTIKNVDKSTTNIDASTTQNIDTTEPSDDTTRKVWSTGVSKAVAPEATEWERKDFGRLVSTISIRHDDAMVISFEKPGNTGSYIWLGGEGSFNIGGDPPLNTAFIWLRTSAKADVENAGYRMEAY